MLNRANYFYRRCCEEGIKNSARIAKILILKRIKKRWLRYKYLNRRARELKYLCYKTPPRKATFYFRSELLVQPSTYWKNYEQEAESTIEIADLICEKKFQWLCPNCPEFSDRVVWNSSFGGKCWPSDFYQDLDYSSEKRLGDIRQVWELNRHQYFVTLGRAYWLTGQARYAQELLKQMFDWIESNPPGYGINWLHAQEVAIRAVAWTWAYQFLCRCPTFTQELKERFLISIYEHANFIMWHLSDGATTHNHLISEACGLAFLGIMYPEFKQSNKWRDKGRDLLNREVLKQVWEDGLDGELATNYHCFVLDSFLQILILQIINGHNVPSAVSQRIEKMIEAVMFLIRPDGSLPLVGDCDSGRAFRLTEFRIWDRRSYLSIGAVLFKRGDFKKVARKFHEEAFWLLGETGLRDFEKLTEWEPNCNDRLFLEGGIATFRTSWDEKSEYMIVRGGPTKLRKGTGTSHNHSDFLSFELYTSERKILVDPGVYLYGESDEWRFFYRKTLAHNTVLIDGLDHIDVTSTRFGVQGIPLSSLHDFRSDGALSLLEMSHSAYEPLGINHKRKFLWVKGESLIIIDIIEGHKKHRVEQFFHFGPGLELNVETEKIGVYVNNNNIVNVFPLFHSKTPSLIESFYGETDEIQGWVSEKYAVRNPANALRLLWECELPLQVATVISRHNKIDKNLFDKFISDYRLKQ